MWADATKNFEVILKVIKENCIIFVLANISMSISWFTGVQYVLSVEFMHSNVLDNSTQKGDFPRMCHKGMFGLISTLTWCI